MFLAYKVQLIKKGGVFYPIGGWNVKIEFDSMFDPKYFHFPEANYEFLKEQLLRHLDISGLKYTIEERREPF